MLDEVIYIYIYIVIFVLIYCRLIYIVKNKMSIMYAQVCIVTVLE